MREVSRRLVADYKLQKLKLDFMGFYFNTINDLSFHHYLVQKQYCKEQGLGEGYIYENGVMVEENAHKLLHTAERLDEDIFYAITSHFLNMKIKEALTKEDLLAIQDMLTYFIREHDRDRNSKGKLIIPNKTIELQEKGLDIIKKRL